jgi:1,4-dihydroxy-2-naphthoyl-CoA synthase
MFAPQALFIYRDDRTGQANSLSYTFMSYETITVEKRDTGVAVLTINRPDKLNALNKQVHTEGVAALDELKGDDSVRVLVITGAGEKPLSRVPISVNSEGRHRSRSEIFFTRGRSSIR